LDKLVPVGALLEQEAEKLSPAQAEEMERMKLRCNGQKAALARKLDSLEVKVKALEAERESVTGDRLRRLPLEKEATQLRRELMKGRESQFFDAMRLDVELEERVKKFAEQEKLTAKVIREFCIKVMVNK
jgi:serine/threonine-protein kinase RIO1